MIHTHILKLNSRYALEVYPICQDYEELKLNQIWFDSAEPQESEEV